MFSSAESDAQLLPDFLEQPRPLTAPGLTVSLLLLEHCEAGLPAQPLTAPGLTVSLLLLVHCEAGLPEQPLTAPGLTVLPD